MGIGSDIAVPTLSTYTHRVPTITTCLFSSPRAQQQALSETCVSRTTSAPNAGSECALLMIIQIRTPRRSRSFHNLLPDSAICATPNINSVDGLRLPISRTSPREQRPDVSVLHSIGISGVFRDSR
jgi:hypothetical protein